MPRLPSAQDINRQQPSTSRSVVGLPVDPMGQALQQTGERVQQVAAYMQRQDEKAQYEAEKAQIHEQRILEEERRKVNVLQKAQAQTGFVQDLNDWQVQSTNDSDYATQPKRFADFAQKSLQKYSSLISDEQERTLFELSAKRDISDYTVKLNSNAYEMRNKQLAANYDETLNRTINQIAAVDDLASKNSLIQAQMQETRAAIQAGILPPSAEPKARQTLQNTLAYTHLDKKSPDELLNAFEGKTSVNFTTTGNQVADETIADVSAKMGVSREYLIRTAQIESGGKVNAKNPNSSAAGLMQLTKDTAASLGKNPYDVRQAVEGASELYLENKARFEKEIGRTPTDAELYVMHQQGAPSAMALFKAASNDENAFDVLTRLHDAKTANDMIVNNGGNLDMSAADFVDKWVRKYEGEDDASLVQYITPSQQDQLKNKAYRTIQAQEKAVAEQQEQVYLADTVSNAIRGDGYINPKDTKQMKMFDVVYNQMILDNPTIAPDDKATGTAEIVKNVGIIPNALKGRLQQVFRLSESPDEIAQFADIVAKVEEESPQVLNDLPNETRIMASYINEGRRAGIDVSDRVASMRNAMLPENAPMIEKRKELLKSDAVKKEVNKNTHNLFDSWMPFMGQEIDTETGVNQLVSRDYRTAFEQSYLMTEDVESAHAYAATVVKAQYAPSIFADGGVMKHPPEMYYAVPNDDGAWIQRYLLEDVNQFYGNQKTPTAEKDAINREIDFIQSKLPTTFNPTEKKLLEDKTLRLQKSIPEGTPLTDNQVRIMSDSRTLREARATGKPSYAVIVTTYPNGYPKVETLKARFTPDVQKRKQERINEQVGVNERSQESTNLRASAKTGVIPQ